MSNGRRLFVCDLESVDSDHAGQWQEIGMPGKFTQITRLAFSADGKYLAIVTAEKVDGDE